MPFVWKQLGIQTQSVQLWQDAGGGRTRDHPETERDRERQRAGGREQRSEKVASTRDVKNCVCVCVHEGCAIVECSNDIAAVYHQA